MSLAVTDWLTLLGLALAAVSFIVGLVQYRQGQRWKAIEFISAEVKEFQRHPHVRAVAQMLDYNRSVVALPAAQAESPPRQVAVDDALLMAALAPHTASPSQTFTDDQLLIRQSFDTFFDYLAQFEHYISATGLVRYADLRPYIGYWLAILCDPRSQRKPQALTRQIQLYLTAYGYDAVLRLCERHLGDQPRRS